MVRRDEVRARPANLVSRVRAREAGRLRGRMTVVVWYAVRHGRRRGRRWVAHVLEGGLVLKVVGHHMVIRRGSLLWRRRSNVLIVLIIIIQVSLSHEILGAFVLVGRAILRQISVRSMAVLPYRHRIIRIGNGRWSR